MQKYCYYILISFSLVLLNSQPGFTLDDADTEILAETPLEVSTAATTEPVMDEALLRELQQSLDHYEKLVAQLESEGGVYHNQLSEVLLGMGKDYQLLGQHADAIEIFQRSLHITRVNDGLYSLNQVAMLEKLIESNSKLKDWEALGNNYHNLYWISKRHYGENSPEMLPLIDRVGRWHLQAFELDPGPASLSHLLNAEYLYNKAIEIINQSSNEYDLRLINALYGIALTNYQIAAQISSAEDFDVIRAGFRNSNQNRRLLQEQQAQQELILRSYSRGKDAMNQIINIHTNNPILPVDTQAIAMTHLGDWYLLFNKRNSAAETYEQAYQLLLNDGMEQEKIDQLFGRPRTLPAIRLPVQNEPDIVPENPAYVLASFDVSPAGRATNIQIVESSPEDNVSYLRRAKRSIASTRFRPRFENGKPVLTTGVSLRYVFAE